MTNQAFEGELTLGVPQDIMYPNIPRVLRQFGQEYPRVKVLLTSDLTVDLRHRFSRREIDVILTTEEDVGPGGEVLMRQPLVWVGSKGEQAWRSRPVRFGSTARCVFRRPALEALEGAGIPGSWRSIRSPARQWRSASPPISRSSCSWPARSRRAAKVRHGGRCRTCRTTASTSMSATASWRTGAPAGRADPSGLWRGRGEACRRVRAAAPLWWSGVSRVAISAPKPLGQGRLRPAELDLMTVGCCRFVPGARSSGQHEGHGTAAMAGTVDEKARGAFFTPEAIADYLAGWAIRAPGDRVLEPSCGEARFCSRRGARLKALGGRPRWRAQLHGIELHAASASAAADRLKTAGMPGRIRTGDFFLDRPEVPMTSSSATRPSSAIRISPAPPRPAASRLRWHRVRLSGLASSWAAFVIPRPSI